MPSSNIGRYFNNFITILRRSGERDDYGGMTVEWEKKYWEVRCRIYGYTGILRLTYNGLEYTISSRLMCDKEVDLQAGDKVVDINNVTYLVVQSIKKQTGRKVHHIEAYLSQINEV